MKALKALNLHYPTLKFLRLGIFILLIGLFSCEKGEHSIYVSPKQQFQNDGTVGLEVALDSVKKMYSKGYDGAIQVILGAGTYSLSKPLVLTEAHSGSSEFPLIISPKGDGEVIISGSQKLELQWQEVEDGLWQAKVPGNLDFDQLFLNGKKAIRARYPNYDAQQNIYNGYAADAVGLERVAGWKDPSTGVLHAMHVSEWGDYHYQITGVDDHGEATLTGGFQNNRQMGMHPEFRYVENIREELDVPGEWFYDQKKGVLFYMPEEDEDLKNASVEVAQMESLIYFSGSENAPIHDIEWHNCTFQHTTYTFMKTDEPLLRSDWKIYRGGAIKLEGTKNIKVVGNRLKQLGGNGIFVSGYNRNTEISGNHISKIGASAVSFVGNPQAVRSPSFEYHESIPYEKLDRKPGPKENTYPSNALVHDNLIHDIGLVEKQTAGIQLSMASKITLSHNSIYNVPRAGINISEGTWGGHLIEFNDVFNTVLETGDHGAFNSWGRDRFWNSDRKTMDKMISKEPSLILLDAIDPTIIRNNRFRCDHGWDIDLDDGSSNYLIQNNLCLNGGIKLREGFYRTVENNIMVNNSFHPHVWFQDSHDIFRHNIVATWYKPIGVEEWGEHIDYNLLPDSTALARSMELGLDMHSKYGDPEFIAPKEGDFRVAKNSPALEIGFENFPMGQFGVVSPSLKELAKTPEIPKLFGMEKDKEGRLFEFLGASVKKLQGLGERSATGMDGERGILIVKVPDGSLAQKRNLMEGDVILTLNKIPTNNMRQLMEAYQGENWKRKLSLKVFRNQKEMQLEVKL